MKKFFFAVACSALLGYAFGRWGHPVKIVETKTVQVEVEREDKTKVFKIETVKPDGTKITKTRTRKDVGTATRSRTEAAKTTVYPGRVSVFIIGARSGLQPVYGGGISAPVLGPIRAGGFGLSNGTLGLTLGLDF